MHLSLAPVAKIPETKCEAGCLQPYLCHLLLSEGYYSYAPRRTGQRKYSFVWGCIVVANPSVPSMPIITEEGHP